MRGQAYRGAPKRGRTVKTASVPAPVGGLNARDAIANMKPTDAIVMDNWVPGTASVALRKGYVSHKAGFAAPVETLAIYRSTTTEKMFAASNGSIYDITTAGALGSSVSTGYANSRFQSANFGTPGGQFLYLVNGSDKAVLYDGTAFKRMTDGTGAAISSITYSGTTATLTTATPHGRVAGDFVTVTGATPADYNVTAAFITVIDATSFSYTMATTPSGNATVMGAYVYGPSIQGVDSALFKDAQVYGRRLWFTEKNSFRIWYLGLQSVSGTASSIDLSSLFILGGSLQGMVVWSITSKYGSFSYAVFVSSEGEGVIYQGYDPDDPTNFTLAGSFRIGKPIGQRFWERVGGETVIITEDGLIPLSKAAFDNRASQSDAISYKIMNMVNDDIETWKGVFGWQIVLYPLGNKIICNSPRPTSADTIQYVMNTITNQWCRYTTLKAHCWALFNDGLYFGSDTNVYQAETGFNDDGAGIASDLQPAYSYFGAHTGQKIFTMARPIVTANGDFRPDVSLSVDFDFNKPISSPQLSLGTSSLWDVNPWDVTSWGDITKTSKDWISVGGIGFSAALRVQALTKDMSVSLQSIDYAWEQGSGVL